MTTACTILLRAIANDGSGDTERFEVAPATFNTAVAPNGKREPVALVNGFTALTVPSGAVWCAIRMVSGAITATVKGVTGDTGIVWQSGTLTALPFCTPLGTAPSIGITANGAGVAEILWL